MTLRQLTTLLLVAWTGACSARSFLSAPPDIDRASRHYLALVAAGQIDSLLAGLHPSLMGGDVRRQLDSVHVLLRQQEPADSAEIVGNTSNTNVVGRATYRVTNLTFQFEGRERWAVANIALLDSAGAQYIVGLHAQSLPQSLQTLNAFTLSGKGPRNIIVLLGALLVALFTVGTAVFVFWARPRRRWLWVFVSLIGVGQLGINWTTGEFVFRPIYVSFLSAGIVKFGLYAPWIVTFGIPLGAIWAIAHTRREHAARGTSVETAA